MISLKVDIDVKPRPDQTQADAEAEMAALVTQYLTHEDHPFMQDYGPDAWGGWVGPFVTTIRVTTNL